MSINSRRVSLIDNLGDVPIRTSLSSIYSILDNDIKTFYANYNNFSSSQTNQLRRAVTTIGNSYSLITVANQLIPTSAGENLYYGVFDKIKKFSFYIKNSTGVQIVYSVFNVYGNVTTGLQYAVPELLINGTLENNDDVVQAFDLLSSGFIIHLTGTNSGDTVNGGGYLIAGQYE